MAASLAIACDSLEVGYFAEAIDALRKWLHAQPAAVVVLLHPLERTSTAHVPEPWLASLRHYEFSGMAYLTRAMIDDEDPPNERIDAMCDAFKAWIGAISDGPSDKTMIERIPMDSSVTVEFAYDCLLLRLYWRGGFMTANGVSVAVDDVPNLLPCTDPRFPERRATVTIGAPLAIDATLYRDGAPA